jgi:DNA-binding CsgD family transcriptional regulator/tetratricopeptide (TPR) repeat protein
MAWDTDPVFVGRTHEFGQLERALDSARAGSGATVLIAGEAGIGKTTMVAELANRARNAGMTVLLGRSMDLLGTELPYQPFAEALRTLGKPWQAPGSQLAAFDETLAILTASAPLLLVLEDLHWADTSTLDLVVYLAHNIDDRPILLLATFRGDEPSSNARMRRLADGVRHSGSAVVVDLGPLTRDEVIELLAGRAEGSVVDAIVARSEGNPFFAEELLAAHDDVPLRVRDLLLRRASGLDDRTQILLRLTAAAGRDVAYPLLCAAAELPERDVRESLRRAVEHGVLVADQASGTFRFRHALLAEAVYGTILPGEREELHGRLAHELSRSGVASPAELALHWAVAGRSTEALTASVEAAREAEAVFALAEAHAHLERALALWPAVPDAAEAAGLDLAQLCTWSSELASQVGAPPRAVELARRAIELIGDSDPHRAALVHVRLGEFLYDIGRNEDALAELQRAVGIVPEEPPSPERAYALGSLAGGLMMAWRYADSLPVSRVALALARDVGAGDAEVRALTVVGCDLVYLGSSEEGIRCIRSALRLAEEIRDYWGLERAYVNLSDALTMLGRPTEAVWLGQAGLEAMRRYGVYRTLLVANTIEALLAIGEWDAAEKLTAAELRRFTASSPYLLLMYRADLESARGDFEAARTHLDAALATLPADRLYGVYEASVAELALWERRWVDADNAAREALAMTGSPEVQYLRAFLCTKALRAQAELAALARARRDSVALGSWLARAHELIAAARRGRSAVSPNTAGWLAMAEAEYERAGGVARPPSWSSAASLWDRLERPPIAAYCRWREAEALVAIGASRTEASAPLREAYAVAVRLGARPLQREIELLAQRARLDLASPSAPIAVSRPLGLTSREQEVLSLLARGYTDREIAATLVISVKTASVHVSHILRKLGAPNRQEAAAIAHRLTPPE